MNTACDTEQPLGQSPQDGSGCHKSRRFSFREQTYVLYVIRPEEPRRILEAEGLGDLARDYDPDRWVLGLSAARTDAPEDILGFYAIAHSGNPSRFDDTLLFVVPRARGRHLSHLLAYGVYLALLEIPHPFTLREIIDHPRLRLHARCGFAPPIRSLTDGRVEVDRFDLNALLSRLESEDEIRELPCSTP